VNANAQLDAVRDALRQTERRGHELAASLDEAAWRNRPVSGGWSVAECLAHLNLTTWGMLPLIEDAIDRARQLGGEAPETLRSALLGRALAWFLEPPYRIRVRTQPAFVAGADLPKIAVLGEWNRAHEALVAVVDRSRGLPIDRVTIVSPFDPRGKMRYSVYSAFLVLAAHERRHLWQAARVADGRRAG